MAIDGLDSVRLRISSTSQEERKQYLNGCLMFHPFFQRKATPSTSDERQTSNSAIIFLRSLLLSPLLRVATRDLAGAVMTGTVDRHLDSKLMMTCFLGPHIAIPVRGRKGIAISV